MPCGGGQHDSEGQTEIVDDIVSELAARRGAPECNWSPIYRRHLRGSPWPGMAMS
jgi:hypothetical protein